MMQPTDVEHIPATGIASSAASSARAVGAPRSSTIPARIGYTSRCTWPAASCPLTTRFLSLIEYFTRAHDAVLRQRSGLPLQSRLYATDGSELTTMLHSRGSSYLDDNARGTGMRRRLAWLGFRRRFVARILPGAVMWAVALVFVVGSIGLDLRIAIAIGLGALAVQALVLTSTSRRS